MRDGESHSGDGHGDGADGDGDVDRILSGDDAHHVGTGMLRMRSLPDGNSHTIALIGDLDLANAAEVEAELRRVEAGECEKIILDLTELDFIDSTGIAMLIGAAKRTADGNRLQITRPRSEQVHWLLELTGVRARVPYG